MSKNWKLRYRNGKGFWYEDKNGERSEIFKKAYKYSDGFGLVQLENGKYAYRDVNGNLSEEIAHLHKVAELLKKYEKRDWQEVIPKGEFPNLLHLRPCKDYIRKVLAESVHATAEKEDYTDSKNYKGTDFIKVQKTLNSSTDTEPVHQLTAKYIQENGSDYRVQDSEHPVKALQSRTEDNTTVGRECVIKEN